MAFNSIVFVQAQITTRLAKKGQDSQCMFIPLKFSKVRIWASFIMPFWFCSSNIYCCYSKHKFLCLCGCSYIWYFPEAKTWSMVAIIFVDAISYFCVSVDKLTCSLFICCAFVWLVYLFQGLVLGLWGDKSSECKMSISPRSRFHYCPSSSEKHYSNVSLGTVTSYKIHFLHIHSLNNVWPQYNVCNSYTCIKMLRVLWY